MMNGKVLALTCLMLDFFGTGHASAQTMRASWYDCPFSAACVAHKTLPKGTRLRLFNPATGALAVGIVMDRGPYVPGRELDVSRELAARLGFVGVGVAVLEVGY